MQAYDLSRLQKPVDPNMPGPPDMMAMRPPPTEDRPRLDIVPNQGGSP